MACGRPRHGLRDRTHAPDRMPPDALLPIHLAEGMVQENVGGPGRIGAGVVPDHGIEAEQGLHQVALEPAIEIVTCRFGEQVVERAQIFRGQPSKPVAEAPGFE